MKKDIYGIEVITSNCNLSQKNVEESCISAESIVDIVKGEIGEDPLKDIKKIELYVGNPPPETKKLIINLNNIKTKEFERSEVVSCEYSLDAALYSEDSIQFDEEVFYPLNSRTFVHELGHNVNKSMSWGRKLILAKMHYEFKEKLIKKIKEGSNPSKAADNILSEYAFLHESEFSKGNLICFEGYVGILDSIVQVLPNNSKKTAKRAYTLHSDDTEFFPEMFTMYFHEWEDLVERGLSDFAMGIIKNEP